MSSSTRKRPSFVTRPSTSASDFVTTLSYIAGPPLAAALVALIITLGAWQALRTREAAHARAMVAASAEAAAEHLSEAVRVDLRALQRMGERWEHHGPTSAAAWRADAQAYLADNAGWLAVYWVTRAGEVGRFERLADASSREPPAPKAIARRVRSVVEAIAPTAPARTMTPRASEHGTGVLLLEPLAGPEGGDGALVAYIDPHAMLAKTLAGATADGYHLRLLAEDHELARIGSAPEAPITGYAVELALEQLPWRLELWPTPTRYAQLFVGGPRLTLAVGLGATLIVSLAAYLAGRARRRTWELKRANRRLYAVEHQLERLVEAVPVGIVVIDGNGEIVFANRELQRLETIGQLTGGVAHDFNNLLTVVLGNAEFIRRGLGEANDYGTSAAQISDAARRGAELCQQLLAFARRQPLRPTILDVGAHVEALRDLLRRALSERVELKIQVDRDLPAACVDGTQLQSALLNLAINARDALAEEGTLTIRATRVPNEPYATPDRDVPPGEYILLSVEDTGEGIPPDILPRVFEPFFSTKPPSEGSGMGLSMVQGFMTQSAGYVRIHSRRGEGTTVRLYLPAFEAVESTQHSPRAG